MGILLFSYGFLSVCMGPPLLVCLVLCEAQKKGFVVVVGQCMRCVSVHVWLCVSLCVFMCSCVCMCERVGWPAHGF